MNQERLKNLREVLSFIEEEIARINRLLDDRQDSSVSKQGSGQEKGNLSLPHSESNLLTELQKLSYMYLILQYLKSKRLTVTQD